jgi:hypothetical protein
MRPGALCKLVGTRGWGELCLLVDTNVRSVGDAKVPLESGETLIISPSFLQVIDETR